MDSTTLLCVDTLIWSGIRGVYFYTIFMVFFVPFMTYTFWNPIKAQKGIVSVVVDPSTLLHRVGIEAEKRDKVLLYTIEME